MFTRIICKLCIDINKGMGINGLGEWVDVQGDNEYRDILVYGLVEYMGYGYKDLESWFNADGHNLGSRDIIFRYGKEIKEGDYWDRVKRLLRYWEREYKKDEVISLF